MPDPNAGTPTYPKRKRIGIKGTGLSGSAYAGPDGTLKLFVKSSPKEFSSYSSTSYQAVRHKCVPTPAL